LGVPYAGYYEEIFNSDATLYAGTNVGNGDSWRNAETLAWMDRDYSIVVNLPPLATVVFKHRHD